MVQGTGICYLLTYISAMLLLGLKGCSCIMLKHWLFRKLWGNLPSVKLLNSLYVKSFLSSCYIRTLYMYLAYITTLVYIYKILLGVFKYLMPIYITIISDSSWRFKHDAVYILSISHMAFTFQDLLNNLYTISSFFIFKHYYTLYTYIYLMCTTNEVYIKIVLWAHLKFM